jgi:hypothetical protein
MIEITTYNEESTEGAIGKCQYNFQLSNSNNKKNRKRNLMREIANAVKALSAGSNSCTKVAPLPRKDFDGIKNGKGVEYHKVKIINFPYRVAILMHDNGMDTKYKFGVQMIGHVQPK